MVYTKIFQLCIHVANARAHGSMIPLPGPRPVPGQAGSRGSPATR